MQLGLDEKVGSNMENCGAMDKREPVSVSILMSVYNAHDTLPAALTSVLDQSYRDYELIICDDASTDASWSILENYAHKDKRIRLIQNEKNLGLGASLNRCLELARGKYIARQDADDISKPERLQRTIEYLIKEDLPYAACGVEVFDDHGVWNRRMFPEHITKHVIAQRNPFFHPTMVFKREVLNLVQGYRPVFYTRRTEDYDLVMRLAGKGLIGQNLQEYLYQVYEPMEAYQRHTVKTRWYEIRTRLYGLREMDAPFMDYIYILKPVVMSLMPRRLIKVIKRLQWKSHG